MIYDDHLIESLFHRFAQEPPRRIVCLVPSLTETLLELSLADYLIGRTKYCIHPAGLVADIEVIGGTKNPNVDHIVRLFPDLIIANKEENRREDIELLSAHRPVYLTDIQNIDDVYSFITNISRLYNGIEVIAQNRIEEISRSWAQSEVILKGNCLYLIWRKPFMAAGCDTFIHTVLTHIGFENLLVDQARYPVIEEAYITQQDPEFILLSSEPYPFTTKHIHEIQALSPTSKILLVDGEIFSWYGVRLIKLADYLRQQILPYFNGS